MKSAWLEATWKLLTQGHDESALESLVDCWREWPAPELAEVIGLFVTRMTARLPPVTAGNTSNRQAWLTLSAQHRTATLGRLFEALPQTTGAWAAERINALRSWPATPALSTGIARWLENPPFEGKNRARCFLPALEVLEAQHDVRVVPLLRRLTETSNRTWAIRQLGLKSWKPLRALTQKAEAWALPHEPSADERLVLDRLRERLAVPKEPAGASVKLEELYAAVYANPDDDTPRLILADVLQDRGDPRGEFIALQVARAAQAGKATRRERELLGTWEREWLGPLAPVLLRGGLVYDRGFVARCGYDGEHVPVGLAAAPEWSTVTHLDVTHAGEFVTGARGLMLSPQFRSLRHVSGVCAPDLRAIADAARALPWESLGLSLSATHGEPWDLLTRSMPLPALTRLAVKAVLRIGLHDLSTKAVAALLAGPLGRTVRRLELGMRPEAFGSLVELATRHALTSIALHPQSRALSLRYDVIPRAVVISLDPVSDANVARVATAMRSVKAGVVDRVLLSLPGRAVVEDDTVVHGAATAKLGPLREVLGRRPLVLPT